MRVLAADIGATHARFAFVDLDAGAARIALERDYATASYPGFRPALDEFLREARGAPAPSHAAIALAGPVTGDAGTLVNRPAWRVERRALESLGVQARILNDFEALACGVAHAAPGDSIVLQAGSPVPRANLALVGAGSGLGVAALVWDGKGYRPAASEGGHLGFAPQNEIQLELCRWLHARHGRVSAERVVSGPGLAAIHEFLGSSPDSPEAISASALAEPFGPAARALDLWVACYGAFAGDIALALLARGGVYICGGIAAQLARRLAEPDFLAAFGDKGRHRGLMAAIPVRLVVNTRLGVLGAAWSAAD